MNTTCSSYTFSFQPSLPAEGGILSSPVWSGVPALELDCPLPTDSGHQPRTRFQGIYNEDALVGLFSVADRYVRSVCTEYQDQVSRDSCVEFFFRPVTPSGPASGYFNFEFNMGGVLLVYYIRNHERVNGFKDYSKLTSEECAQVVVEASRPGVTDPEITDPVDWQLAFRIPRHVLEIYAGPLGVIQGSTWSANFYKCASDTSHPHWISWQPLSAKNFHLPEHFGPIHFAPSGVR